MLTLANRFTPLVVMGLDEILAPGVERSSLDGAVEISAICNFRSEPHRSFHRSAQSTNVRLSVGVVKREEL